MDGCCTLKCIFLSNRLRETGTARREPGGGIHATYCRGICAIVMTPSLKYILAGRRRSRRCTWTRSTPSRRGARGSAIGPTASRGESAMAMEIRSVDQDRCILSLGSLAV